MHPFRRTTAAAAIAVIIGMCAVPSVALAQNAFGTRFWNYGSAGGSNSHINTPNDPPIALSTFVLHRVVDQNDFSSVAGLVQLGIFRSGGASLDTCGTGDPTAWMIYSEYKTYGSPNTPANYHCQLFAPLGVFNEPEYAVCRYPHGGNFRDWAAVYQGTLLGTYYTAFYDAYDMAGAEGVNGGSADYNRYDSWYAFDNDLCTGPHLMDSTAVAVSPVGLWSSTTPSSGQFFTNHP